MLFPVPETISTTFYSLTLSILEVLRTEHFLWISLFTPDSEFVAKMQRLLLQNIYLCRLSTAHPTIKIKLSNRRDHIYLTSSPFQSMYIIWQILNKHNICEMNFKVSNSISSAHYIQTKCIEHQVVSSIMSSIISSIYNI